VSEPLHAPYGRPGDGTLGTALALVRLLRERCPWDARQTRESLRPYLLEEAHETAEAVAAGDDAALAEELGDLLLNVAFQIVLAEERGAFDATNVVAGLEDKMRRRHPHVYGDEEEPPDWEALKAVERAREAGGAQTRPGAEAGAGETAGPADMPADPFAGVPGTLEPLARGYRLQQRAAALGFDWDDVAGPLAKVREELDELEEELGRTGDARGRDADSGGRLPGPSHPRLEEEVGDLLFAAVNLARRAGVHPSNALGAANRKFRTRFRALLALASERRLDPASATLAELDVLWDEVKAGEGD
jgi:MazG family protein